MKNEGVEKKTIFRCIVVEVDVLVKSVVSAIMPATVCKTICQLFSLLFEPLHKAVQLYLVSALANVGDLNNFDA